MVYAGPGLFHDLFAVKDGYQAKMSRPKELPALFVLALSGVAADFLVNGVLKLIWIVIYGATYLGIAASIYNRALTGRWRESAGRLAVAFLAGAALGHVALTGRSHLRSYSMTALSASPITLGSPDFSDQLLVTSSRLQQELSRPGAPVSVPVTIQVVQNYGCIESFRITSIGDVDMMADPQATWVWKAAPGVPPGTAARSGLAAENARLPWCQIHWF